MTVVEAVGARLRVQASEETLASRKMSLRLARVEVLQPQMAISVASRRLSVGIRPQELFGFAAVGECENDAAGGEHAEVAVNGFGSVEEVGWCTCGAEGGGDLAGDDAALADAGDDDATVGGRGLEEMVDCLREWDEHGGVEAEGKFVEGGGLDADEL